jgi:hypothetical protein
MVGFGKMVAELFLSYYNNMGCFRGSSVSYNFTNYDHGEFPGNKSCGNEPNKEFENGIKLAKVKMCKCRRDIMIQTEEQK